MQHGADEAEALRGQLEERDFELAEMRATLHALKHEHEAQARGLARAMAVLGEHVSPSSYAVLGWCLCVSDEGFLCGWQGIALPEFLETETQ